MMPTLLDAFLTSNTLNEHAHFSLKKMALGGLFDVLGGGFHVIRSITVGMSPTLKKWAMTTDNY